MIGDIKILKTPHKAGFFNTALGLGCRSQVALLTRGVRGVVVVGKKIALGGSPLQ